MEQPQFDSPHTPSPSTMHGDEMTLKNIILKIQEWFALVWPQKNIIIAASLAVGLASALYTKFLTKSTYTASYQLFFQEESGGLSSAMRLASSFGLGGGGSSASSSATVQEYLTSRSNIAHAMTAPLDAGRLVDRYFAQALEENEVFKSVYTANFGINQRYTDSVITQVFLALNQGVIVAAFDEESGVLGFNVTSEDEAFTYDLATELVQNTESQFKDWKREKVMDAVRAFQTKVDSLEFAIDVTLQRLGEYSDQNNSLISSVDKIKETRLMIDMEALKVAYGEYIKGLEMSKAELMNMESPFKYFDEPTFPLAKEKASAANSGVFGSFITGFLLVLFFIARAEAKNIMA